MKEKIKNKINSWTRPSRKWTDIFIISVALSLGILLAGDYIMYLLFKPVPFDKVFSPVSDSPSVLEFLSMYVMFLGIWIIALPICAIFKSNRPILKQLAPNKNGNNFKGLLAGLLLGFGLNGICILISVLTGKIHLYFNEFNPLLFFVFLFFVAVQSGAEELVTRVYLYQKLRRRYKSPLVAIIGNSLLFAALHLFNEGITVISVIEIFVSGILFSLLIHYYDSAWGAIMIHTAWNFTQNIVFGLPNSGMVSEYSLFKLEAASAENGLFYNVGFGVEGSVGSLILYIITIGIIIYINRGKGEKNDVWANYQNA
ncbi:MAG: CPBP family intramembrane metalloprotease [Eubacterium sp.]|nr:CPBP family intramembrane metalloprotease [Eubacterium sp.]